MLTLLRYLSDLLRTGKNGSSPVVQESAAPIISTSNPLQLDVKRTSKTELAIFGTVSIGNEQICYSMERLAVCIPTGSFSAHLRYSPHFDMTVPGIDVQNRKDIEMHPANFVSQLEGCIAVGDSIDNGALDNSRAAFDRLMIRLPQTFTVSITEDYK